MKRLLLLLALIYPYLIALSVICLYTGHVPGGSVFVQLTILSIFWLFGLAMSAAYCLYNVLLKADSLQDARDMMTLRLIQIPAYIFNFAAGVLGLITVITAGVTIVLIILCVMSRMLSGLAGLSAAIRASKKVGTPLAIACGVLGFLWLADVISAVILHTRLCKTQSKLSPSDKI